MDRPAYVFDASAGVKWFRDEAGSRQARELLTDHVEQRALIVVDTLFFYEVLAAATRDRACDDAVRVWGDLASQELITVPLGCELVAAAMKARAQLGCSLCDAFSAGLADLLGAPLYSADARAHGAHPRVRLIV